MMSEQNRTAVGAIAAAATVILAVFLSVFVRAQDIDIGAPPGRLVDIGGRTLHLNCTGQGAPTIVLEAGAGAFSIDWALVQPTLARTNRTCSYDRAHYAWSGQSPKAETPEAVVQDLHTLLVASGERPPFVLVGQSMGGIYARIYVRRYPADVVGMVFVDPAHEGDLFNMFEGRVVTIASMTREQVLSTIPDGDATIPLRQPQTGEPFTLLPDNLYTLRVALERRLLTSDASKPVPHATVVEAVEGMRAALAELQQGDAQPQALGDRPIVVLTRGVGMSDRLRGLHLALSQSSSNGRHMVVAGSGHEIQLYQPAVVIQAIQDVLESIRTKAPLPGR